MFWPSQSWLPLVKKAPLGPAAQWLVAQSAQQDGHPAALPDIGDTTGSNRRRGAGFGIIRAP